MKNTHMTDYTAHVQLPDAAVGLMFHEMLAGMDTVTFSVMRTGSSTWISFGVNAGSDDDATMLVSSIVYSVSRLKSKNVPEGYDEDLPALFETAPMIVTAGRTVVHSSGV